MSEPAGEISGRVRFSAGHTLVDAAVGGWLAYAGGIFRDHPLPLGVTIVFASAAALVLAFMRAGFTGRPWYIRVGLALAGIIALAAAFQVGGTIARYAPGWPFAWRLATAATLLSSLAGLTFRRLGNAPGWESLLEALRWVAVLAVGTCVLAPFYTAHTIGAGDATWYTQMLGDFTEQIRLGVFPVWLGQTEMAFNGAFSPLRLAPGFQHLGGVLDLLTGHSLGYPALKNLVLACSGLLLAFSSYFCLRGMLVRRPWLAAALTMLLLFSPAILSSIYIGDQYMTFVALPFMPVVFYSLWRAYQLNDLASQALLAVGLAGLWHAHTPIALWTSGVAAMIYFGKMLRYRGQGELARLALSGVVFSALAAWPLLSAFSLENTARLDLDPGTVWDAVVKAFPANLGRLSKGLMEPADYQPGLTLLVLLGVSIVMLPWRRSAAAIAMIAGLVLIALFSFPVPGVSHFLWHHIPSLVIQVTNAWPMQRLIPIAGCLIVFLFATQLATGETGRRHWPWLALLLALPLAGWSLRELLRLHERARTTIVPTVVEQPLLLRNNLLLTRYAYASFANAPGSFSHGYMDPVLEHRLLRRDRSPLAANLESAARKGALPLPDPGDSLLAHGTLVAVNDNNSNYYNLNPALTLPANVPLVLWLEPRDPGQPGWLQVIGKGIFREYILPDSGIGLERREPLIGFGTLPTSRPIIPLSTPEVPHETPRFTVIAPQRPIVPQFDFARFELWRYEPAALPVVVHTWAPYRLTVRAPEPAYLETPRMWMRGYEATINGEKIPVKRSPDNLAMFPVPAGTSEVRITYRPPWLLQLAYWSALLGWISVLGLGVRNLARQSDATANRPV